MLISCFYKTLSNRLSFLSSHNLSLVEPTAGLLGDTLLEWRRNRPTRCYPYTGHPYTGEQSFPVLWSNFSRAALFSKQPNVSHTFRKSLIHQMFSKFNFKNEHALCHFSGDSSLEAFSEWTSLSRAALSRSDCVWMICFFSLKLEDT